MTMTAKMQMVTARRFGFSNRAQLNLPLTEAVRAEAEICETCRDIGKEVDSLPEGSEFVESGSFPGRTVQKLDAHFKAHWKDGYELVDLSGRKDPV
jgi:hypothetical protein